MPIWPRNNTLWLHNATHTLPFTHSQLLDNEGDGPFWAPSDIRTAFRYVRWPSLHWAGWYDIFLEGTLYGFQGYRELSHPAVRDQHRLIVDPLGHCGFDNLLKNPKPGHLPLSIDQILLPIYMARDMFLKAENAFEIAEGRMPRHPAVGHSTLDEGTLDEVDEELPTGSSFSLGDPFPHVPASVKRITFFVMGPDVHTMESGTVASGGGKDAGVVGNYWTSMDEWPLYNITSYFLAEAQRLTEERPTAGSDSWNTTIALAGGVAQVTSQYSSNYSYDYDPRDPVKTEGGNNLFGSCGPVDQRSTYMITEANADADTNQQHTGTNEEERVVESGNAAAAGIVPTGMATGAQMRADYRADYRVFDSPPLTQPLAITGPITATLYVTSNRSDTDFAAKLTDVYPDGRDMLLQDGMSRLRWREHRPHITPPMQAQPRLITPGQIYEITISLSNTSYIFNPGHRIRLAITSSNYPRYANEAIYNVLVSI